MHRILKFPFRSDGSPSSGWNQDDLNGDCDPHDPHAPKTPKVRGWGSYPATDMEMVAIAAASEAGKH